MSSFVSHLESALDGTHLEARTLQTVHKQRPLWVRYDLDRIRSEVNRDCLNIRDMSMWRYRELLPHEDELHVVSLGEGVTPILHCDRLGKRLGLGSLFIKDESRLPTGSFKSRGQAIAVSMVRAFGERRLAIPSAGNAAGAMAAYAARAGLDAWVFMPVDTPSVNIYECAAAGAHVYLVEGLITECGKIVRSGAEHMNWFDFSTLKEPYRIEGKKTMGLEIAEQFGWTLPDVILYPTGGGTGLIGMWKAFRELQEIGWLETDTLPRMVAVQSDGCCPIVRAWEAGSRFAEPFEQANTIARGLRVPVAAGDFMILDAIRESNGCAVAVEEGRIIEWMNMAYATEGISVCPESAACVGAAEILAASGWIRPKDRVVLFNCAAVQKYVEALKTDVPVLSPSEEPDWEKLLR